MRADAQRVAVVGAGIGGLVAAALLAARGVDVTVVERAATPGGKLRAIELDGLCVDAGPTVFTMRRVFDEIFAAAGTRLSDHLVLRRVDVLARHAWSRDERLDLHADVEATVDAIGAFAGPADARGYRAFSADAKRVYETLEASFIRAARPSLPALVRGRGSWGDLWGIRPFTPLWRALGGYFRDPRLRQLFGRYATYCGASPFLTPATLMLVAHVERDGVWLVDGGMHRLAAALAEVAGAHGATFRYGTAVDEIVVRDGRVAGVRLASGERIAAGAVVVNGDTAAIAGGAFGGAAAGAVPRARRSARSLSAITWALVARTGGFPLLRHNVFFSRDYAAEFDDIFRRGRPPAAPTVYVCAQDRGGDRDAPPGAAERLLCLINAPATGDTHGFDAAEVTQCEQRAFGLLERCGLTVDRARGRMQATTPRDFDRLYPATGGALYGPASHGWMASFRRPGSRTAIPGMYLAGGSTHPGPGVPMAALSGQSAALALLTDLPSTARSRPAAISGGTSMRRATTAGTR